MSVNPGKDFEKDFINSVPDEWFKYRLRDSSGSWSNTETSRFTPTNMCDFIVYNNQMWALELKSHKGKSIPLSCIRPKQVEGLTAAYKKGVQAGYVFNFRDTNETYFVYADKVNQFMHDEEKKSLSLNWVKKHGIYILQVKKKVRYNYNLEFMSNLSC